MKATHDRVHQNSSKNNSQRKRALKHQSILDCAIQLFNANGISGTNIADIAKALGLARASLYHYVEDRSDLVYQCYQRSCDITARDLERASEAEDGLSKTLNYIHTALDPKRQPIAVLSEITSLAGNHKQAIHQANRRNTQRITQFIEEGIEDGSIRPCNVELATHSIVGMLAWSQLLPLWSASADIQRLRERARSAMLLVLDRGVAVEANYKFRCDERVEQFLPKLENAFDRKQASALKVDSFLARASKMFNRTGIESTSIDAVAESLGVTKGAVYHHFEDKSQLVALCYERSFELYDRFCEQADLPGGNGLDCSLTNSHLNIQAQVGSLSPLMPQPGFESVATKEQRLFKSKSAQQNRAIAKFLRRGIEEGIAVACDAPVVTHVCAGAFGWIPKWLPADSEHSGVDIADAMCDLVANGLRQD